MESKQHSVTGKITEAGIVYTRTNGATTRMYNRIIFSLLAGSLLLGCLGGLVLYGILCIIFFLLELINIKIGKEEFDR